MPIAYLSAPFSDTQFKWSTFVKEGYAIYYAIKKRRCYLDDADILLKSGAKSLENFLHELQQSDKHCIGIAKLMADLKSGFNERDPYGCDDSRLLYHLNRENGKEFKATVVPKSLIKTVLQEMHDHFGHFGIGNLFTCKEILLLA